MITSPSKSDSNKSSSTSNKDNIEISDNKVLTDYSVPSLPIPNAIIGEDINNSNKNSKNLSQIHTSIISDNLEKLEKLLKLGENPDTVNKLGETPLYLSVDIENYDAMIILLEFGADCNVQKNDGNTPLHLATEKKNDLYITALLSHGANPNIINKTNLQTPLHIGIINKINEYVLNKFKENNGDIYNIKDKYNKTPFDYASNNEKYKNLLISIFSEQNKFSINNKYPNDNKIENENNPNLDYHNFISLSRNIHITDEDNNEQNNNINDNKESEKTNSNISVINNCLKKHLIFSSNSKETSSEEKKRKLILSGTSNSSGVEQNDKSSQGDVNKNIINIISDKSSNYSNNTNNNKNILNHNIKIYNENIENNNIITETNNDIEKKNIKTSIKKDNILKKNNSNYNFILSSPVNFPLSCSLHLSNKLSSIKKSTNSNNINENNNNINNLNTNTNNTNTNGNNSLSSYYKKKGEGISELNPLDMINQMASSNNSNIFSELQINTNTNNKDGENTDIKNIKTEEEFYNEENIKLTLNDELNTMKDNLSGNFSLNNNDNENLNDNENINDVNENEEDNKENINFINSLDDSLEYSKTKSYIINDTPVVMNKDNNNNSESAKINNKDESLNIYNSNSHNFNTDNNIIRNIKNKNIERYKNSTSNKSKKDYDIDSEPNFSYEKSSNISNISSILPNNKQYLQHHRQLSYHNNKQSSNNKNKINNNTKSNIINSNINISNYNNSTNKENLEPNNINENQIYINKTYNNNKKQDEDEKIINNNHYKSLKNKDINMNSFPLNTMVIQQKIYKNKNILPDVIKEQKTKDSTIEYFKTNEKMNDKNDENIIFLNDNTNSNYNYNEGQSNTYAIDNTNQNQYNTYYSDNNSCKISRESNNYSNLFRKALKKKYLIKEFSQNSKYYTDIDKQKEHINQYNDMIHSQQISNELVTKLRDWLISCDLLCYYNLLIKNNIYDIESYITNLKNNKINISYKDIEDLGIKKPGHIFRFLLKLQMDIGILDNRVCNYILNKFNENILTTIGVNVSVNEIKYCGMILCPGSNDFSKGINYTDIFTFLKNKNLMEYKENFVHNGFDQIEFILIQLFSSFAFNKEILNDYMHIYSDQDKIKVIKELYEEKRIISKEIGIDYDEREVFNILNDQFEEIDNSDNKKKNKNNICNIF